MIITVRAILIALFKYSHILPKCALAFLAHEGQFNGFSEGMVFLFFMAFWAL